MTTRHPEIDALLKAEEAARREKAAEASAQSQINALQAEINRLSTAIYSRPSQSLDERVADALIEVAEEADETIETIKDLVRRATEPLKADIAALKADIAELQTKNFPSRGRLTLVDRDGRDAASG